MKNQRGTSGVEALFSLVIILFVCIVALSFSAYRCHSQWSDAGMKSVSWGPINGCMLEFPDGRRIPADRVREIDLPRAQK